MITFILPGGSVKNKEWLEETALNLKVDGFIRPIFWDHWTDPVQKFDPKEKSLIISRHTKGETINILAKSIGSLVASYIIEEIPKQIEKIIICGIPLNDISEDEKMFIRTKLGSLDKDKLIVYQNISDPHASYEEVKKFLPQDIKLVCTDRSDHHYPFYAEFNKFLNP